MRKTILIIVILLFHHTMYCIDLHRVIGGRSAAMGRTGCCDRNPWSLQNNPAGIASLQGWQFGLYYENQWLLKETAFKSGIAIKTLPNIGTLGLLVNQFGGSDHSESLFGLAYARAFGPYLQIGLRADYYLFHWGDAYPHRGALGFMLGLQSQLTERLRVGACLAHPVQRLKTLHEDRLPIVMRFGITYCFTKDFIGQCEIEHDNSREGVKLKAGLEYEILHRFHIRAGAQHNPNLLSFGVGYMLKGIEMDVAAEVHALLGPAIHVGFCFELRGRPKNRG